MADVSSTAAIRAGKMAWPALGWVRERIHAVPTSATWRFTRALVSRKYADTAIGAHG